MIYFFRNGEDESNATYTLSFNVEFPHEDDCVFLAHSYPYTYTDLQEYLIKLQVIINPMVTPTVVDGINSNLFLFQLDKSQMYKFKMRKIMQALITQYGVSC